MNCGNEIDKTLMCNVCAISVSCIPKLASVRLNIGVPVVRAYSHVITKFSRMGRLPHFLSDGAPSTRASRPRGAPLLN